jgi:glycosyltransferase involved in cell wall biosynthesis
MDLPLVSFIIPYFNAGVTIQETIDSIFNQSYSNFDVWLINDGSTDFFSIEKLKDFEGNNKIHILHQDNSGPSVARNNAIKLSHAEFILPLDADDKVLKNTIYNSIIEFNEDSQLGIVYGDLEYFGEDNFIKNQIEFVFQNQLLWNQIAICCLIKKNVFTTVGYYDEELSILGLEDWEYWIRVGKSKWKFKKINEIQFQIRVTKSSRTYEVANKNLKNIKEIVVKKHHEIFLKEYSNLFYEKKMLLETPDYRIGHFILRPLRFIKKIFNYAI